MVVTESLKSRYLWTNEREVSLEGIILSVPRLVSNKPLNNQLNSTRRDTTESVLIDEQPIELLSKSEGEPFLRKAKRDPDMSDLTRRFSDISVQFSMPFSLNVCGDCYLFVCLGTLVGTEELVIAFSESDQSVARARKEWTYKCTSAICGYEIGFLRCDTEHVLAQALLSEVASFGFYSRAASSNICEELWKILFSACMQVYASLKVSEAVHTISLHVEDISNVARVKGHTYVLDWKVEK